jgi:hypothetical protein
LTEHLDFYSIGLNEGALLMHFDFPTILVALTLGTGAIWLLDRLWLRKQRQQRKGPEAKEPWLV